MHGFRFHDSLKAKIEAEIAIEQAKLGDGVATSFEDYAKRCGRIKGLRDAFKLADDVRAEMTSQPL